MAWGPFGMSIFVQRFISLSSHSLSSELIKVCSLLLQLVRKSPKFRRIAAFSGTKLVRPGAGLTPAPGAIVESNTRPNFLIVVQFC